MLHEIILSLSGHPSPLLSAHGPNTSLLSPPEKALLASVAHLSDLNCKLLEITKEISSKHSSSICQAVATAIRSTHLAKFQRKVIEVEDGILRKDAGIVGAYNIVPLTAVVGQFTEWTRRMEWLWEITKFMTQGGCTGARIIDRVCDAVQTGYSDIEEVALNLVQVAETAWLKQASSWILYGRLPSFGQNDFFVHQDQDDAQEYVIEKSLIPGFVNTSAAASILFIGRSLNHIRMKGIDSSNGSLGLLQVHLRQLSSLTFPISTSQLSSVVSAIRLSLSQSALQQLLPLSRILELLLLLHEFFLLGRGEFAIALITEADEKIRSRWRRSDNLAYEKRDRLNEIVVKEGEVSAVLARTWAAMFSLQGMNDDEDDRLELAREIINLKIMKSTSATPLRPRSSPSSGPPQILVSTPFNNLLLSVATSLSLKIPSPLDLFITPAEVHTYSAINAYLLSIRRAHLRLTDLWKITSLRRDHPSPPAPPYGSSTTGQTITKKLRARAKSRAQILRSVWATSSAAIFLLGEAETYFQGEVINGTWDGFHEWLQPKPLSRPTTSNTNQQAAGEDFWSSAGRPALTKEHTATSHDPQTLSTAHRYYLQSLARNLLLTTLAFTTPLYHLLQQIDHLVALVHRIHSIWQSLDLEVDQGVVDAFSDFRKEEKDVAAQLSGVAGDVKHAIEAVVASLRDVDLERDVVAEVDMGSLGLGEEDSQYRPRRVGRVDRLLMKLDFGGWFDSPKPVGGDLAGQESDLDEL